MFAFVFVSVDILSLRMGQMKRHGAAAGGKLSSEVPVIDRRDARVLPEGSETASAMQTSYQTLTDAARWNAGHGQVKREDKLSPRPR